MPCETYSQKRGIQIVKTILKTLWSQIRESNFLEFVAINEIGIVETYIESNDVKPYFTK